MRNKLFPEKSEPSGIFSSWKKNVPKKQRRKNSERKGQYLNKGGSSLSPGKEARLFTIPLTRKAG